MPTIAVIDDRAQVRETLARILSSQLPAEWQVLEADPLERMTDYPSWLFEHDCACLVLDERLDEQPQGTRARVSYRGHELVDDLRTRLPTFPIFVVTSYADDIDLQERFGAVEEIVARRDFTSRPSEFAARFSRAGQRFVDSHERELARLASLAERIAAGDGTEQDLRQAQSLQHAISLSFPFDEVSSRAQWLAKLQEDLDGWGALKEEITTFLDGEAKD